MNLGGLTATFLRAAGRERPKAEVADLRKQPFNVQSKWRTACGTSKRLQGAV